GARHGRLQVRRKAQPPRRHVAGNELIEPGLKNWHLATGQALDLGRVLVDAGDVDAELREACPGDQADIACPDHRDSHMRELPLPSRPPAIVVILSRPALTTCN